MTKKQPISKSLVKVVKRPIQLKSVTHKITMGCGDINIVLSKLPSGQVVEVFLKTDGKAGCCRQSFLESMGRILSITLRSGVDPKETIKQLIGISCDKGAYVRGYDLKRAMYSCLDAVGVILNYENDKPVDINKIKRVGDLPNETDTIQNNTGTSSKS